MGVAFETIERQLQCFEASLKCSRLVPNAIKGGAGAMTF